MMFIGVAADPRVSNLTVVLPPDSVKAGAVKTMFGRIAGRYDLMNHLMTFGRDRHWQREVVRLAGLRPGGRLFLSEPRGHVDRDVFLWEYGLAREAGLDAVAWPRIARQRSVVMQK